MPNVQATRPDGGFFISITLPEGTTTTAVRAKAATQGLNLTEGLAFFPEGGGERFLRAQDGQRAVQAAGVEFLVELHLSSSIRAC